MATAQDLVGQTIYARKRVPILQWPIDDSPVLRFVEKGQRIGIIRGWSQKPGKKFWYWEFDDANSGRGQHAVFFVPHMPDILDMPRLEQQYNDNLEAQRRRNLQWWERVVEDGTSAVQAGTSKLYTGAFLLIGGYLISKAIFSK